ncbi:MAG: polysaccharide biosynthesis/export family protein [Longimicrobiales bacterium]
MIRVASASKAWGGLLLFTVAIGGCQSASNGPSAPFLAPSGPSGLVPGDAVRLLVYREEDLSGDYQVDQNGVLVLPLLGERRVEGMTPDSLERTLVTELGRFLETTSIDVIVLRRVAILGEVADPGLYPVDPTITLADALALAGGIGSMGDRNDIRLLREGEELVGRLEESVVLGRTPLRSGDQILVGQRGWFTRNLGLVGVVIGAATSISIALFLS